MVESPGLELEMASSMIALLIGWMAVFGMFYENMKVACQVDRTVGKNLSVP
jgi:hypothetical protein